MEMMGAITGLIGAGLQAQAQHDNLMFQYAHFNWEKQRADTQDRFAQASRTDQYGNTTGYDPILNKWGVTLAPMQKDISDLSQKEQLLQLKEDAPAARRIKQAIQARARDAKEPYLKASLGYQYDQPESEKAIRSDLTSLMATNDQASAKANQANLIREAARMGHGGKASEIIQATDQALGNEQNVRDRMLKARTEALKEFSGRQQLHEEQWGKPMQAWGALMAQGGDMPGIPKSAATDSTGAMQQQMLQAFNQGTARVGSAFDSLAGAAGKSVDLSNVAKLIAGIGSKGKSKSSSDESDDTSSALSGTSTFSPSQYSFYDPQRGDFGVNNDYSTAFG